MPPKPQLSAEAQEYLRRVNEVEALIKQAIAPKQDGVSRPDYRYVQATIDELQSDYQSSRELGRARYKLLELQALLFYFQGMYAESGRFIARAIEIHGGTYLRAEQIQTQLQAKAQQPQRSLKNSNQGGLMGLFSKFGKNKK